MKKHFIIFLVTVILIFYNTITFAQDKQKDLIESYIGKWSGDVTILNINRSGGWGESFLGFHELYKEMLWLHLDFKIIHPLDDPIVIEYYKKMGYLSDFFQDLKNLMLIPDDLKITGHLTARGFEQRTHETKIYCEECTGKDYTTEKNFPGIVIPVSGRVDLKENKIHFLFEDVPRGYNIDLGMDPENIKFVKPDKIVIKYESFEGPAEGSLVQKTSGELYKIYTQKDTIGKTIYINEQIKTDKFTQRNIVVPNKGEVIINTNSECIFKEDKLLEQTFGEIYYKIKPGINYKVRIPKTSACAVRGTQFITKVEEGGTTTLTVIDGEVEFSDKQKRKTVLVKKNQKSIVNPGGLPSEPVYINPKMIPRWWE